MSLAGAAHAQSISATTTLRGQQFESESGGPSHILRFEFSPKLTVPLGDAGLLTFEALASRRGQGTRVDTFDFQRAKIDFSFGQVDVTLGNDLVFLGVTEGAQLIDIINQRDLDMDFTGDTKLGQPMLRLGTAIGDGRAELFVLDNWRGRRFRAPEDRLSIGMRVDEASARRINSPEDVGIALRYARSVGNFDLDFLGFRGINRTPALVPVSATELVPVYSDTTQFGMAAQWTYDNVIGKFELLSTTDAPTRDGSFAHETMAAIGAEVARYGVFGSPADMTYVAELSYSSLGQKSVSDYQNDLLLGLNLDFNDVNRTTFTAAVVHDLYTSSNKFELTFERRLSDAAKVEARYYNFSDIDARDVEAGLREDSVFELAFKAFF